MSMATGVYGTVFIGHGDISSCSCPAAHGRIHPLVLPGHNMAIQQHSEALVDSMTLECYLGSPGGGAGRLLRSCLCYGPASMATHWSAGRLQRSGQLQIPPQRLPPVELRPKAQLGLLSRSPFSTRSAPVPKQSCFQFQPPPPLRQPPSSLVAAAATLVPLLESAVASPDSAAMSSDEETEFVFGVPKEVPTHYPIPAEKAGLAKSRVLAEAYGRTGEYVNAAFDLIANEFATQALVTTDSGVVSDAKGIVRGHMRECYVLLQDAGDDAFPLPKELHRAFKFLNLTWPPVMQSGDAAAK